MLYISCIQGLFDLLFDLLLSFPYCHYLFYIMSILSASQPVNKKCQWTHKDNEIMIKALLAAKTNGAQSGNGFKPVVWGTVAVKLKEQNPNASGAEKISDKCLDHWHNVSIIIFIIYILYLL